MQVEAEQLAEATPPPSTPAVRQPRPAGIVLPPKGKASLQQPGSTHDAQDQPAVSDAVHSSPAAAEPAAADAASCSPHSLHDPEPSADSPAASPSSLARQRLRAPSASPASALPFRRAADAASAALASPSGSADTSSALPPNEDSSSVPEQPCTPPTSRDARLRQALEAARPMALGLSRRASLRLVSSEAPRDPHVARCALRSCQQAQSALLLSFCSQWNALQSLGLVWTRTR